MSNVIAEQGSLELHQVGDDYTVHFAAHTFLRGFGSLEAVDDFNEIYVRGSGEVQLNGTQKQTVKRWRQQYG